MATPDKQPEVSGKGRPTPRRRDREAQARRPLVPNSRAERRAKLREQRDRARIGLANGEERYLPLRDRGPQRRWVRDYVDARWNFGEFLIPMMFAVIVATFIPSMEAQFTAIIILWVFFALSIADSMWLGRKVKRAMEAKFGAEKVEAGVRWYAAMRGLQMRSLRLPKPMVKRGEKPA